MTAIALALCIARTTAWNTTWSFLALIDTPRCEHNGKGSVQHVYFELMLVSQKPMQ